MSDETNDRIADIIGKRLGSVYTSRHTLLDCADAVLTYLADQGVRTQAGWEARANERAALLAVAKAAAEDGCCDTSGACEGAESHSATNDALVDLTAANPGWFWREWQS